MMTWRAKIRTRMVSGNLLTTLILIMDPIGHVAIDQSRLDTLQLTTSCDCPRWYQLHRNFWFETKIQFGLSYIFRGRNAGGGTLPPLQRVHPKRYNHPNSILLSNHKSRLSQYQRSQSRCSQSKRGQSQCSQSQCSQSQRVVKCNAWSIGMWSISTWWTTWDAPTYVYRKDCLNTFLLFKKNSPRSIVINFRALITITK